MRPIEHGADRGYQAERRRGLVPCEACVEAHRIYNAERRAVPAPPRELVPCGTPSAWRRHKRRDETPCGPCVEAHRDEVIYYQRKRGAA